MEDALAILGPDVSNTRPFWLTINARSSCLPVGQPRSGPTWLEFVKLARMCPGSLSFGQPFWSSDKQDLYMRDRFALIHFSFWGIMWAFWFRVCLYGKCKRMHFMSDRKVHSTHGLILNQQIRANVDNFPMMSPYLPLPFQYLFDKKLVDH